MVETTVPNLVYRYLCDILWCFFKVKVKGQVNRCGGHSSSTTTITATTTGVIKITTRFTPKPPRPMHYSIMDRSWNIVACFFFCCLLFCGS